PRDLQVGCYLLRLGRGGLGTGFGQQHARRPGRAGAARVHRLPDHRLLTALAAVSVSTPTRPTVATAPAYPPPPPPLWGPPRPAARGAQHADNSARRQNRGGGQGRRQVPPVRV